jgi:hypothetical protein
VKRVLIARAVTVKSKVTPNLKAQLGAETQKAIKDADQEIERVSAEIQRRQGAGRPEDAARLEKERQELLGRKEGLVKQLKDIAKLKDGQEIARGQVQGYYELRVGDIWPEVLSCEIVVEDGRVVAIRDGKTVSVAVRSEGEPS